MNHHRPFFAVVRFSAYEGNNHLGFDGPRFLMAKLVEVALAGQPHQWDLKIGGTVVAVKVRVEFNARIYVIGDEITVGLSEVLQFRLGAVVNDRRRGIQRNPANVLSVELRDHVVLVVRLVVDRLAWIG